MKKALKRIEGGIYFYRNGEKVVGVPEGVTGDLTGIWGNLTGIKGDLTNITGNLTSIWGDLTGISGNLDDCELTEEERKNGVRVEDLIEE